MTRVTMMQAAGFLFGVGSYGLFGEVGKSDGGMLAKVRCEVYFDLICFRAL